MELFGNCVIDWISVDSAMSNFEQLDDPSTKSNFLLDRQLYGYRDENLNFNEVNCNDLCDKTSVTIHFECIGNTEGTNWRKQTSITKKKLTVKSNRRQKEDEFLAIF